jgi:hypothetical protein
VLVIGTENIQGINMIFVHTAFKAVVTNCNSNRRLIVGLNYSGKIHKYVYDTKKKYVSEMIKLLEDHNFYAT